MLRAWDGKLLRPVTEYGMNGPVVVEAGSDRFPRSVAKKTFEEDLTAAIARVDEEYSELVIVNGEVWKVATEPTYVIHTMGLGNNYGGTALSIESGRMETMSRRCFSLLERDAAVEAALEVARDRGDTRSYDLIRESDSATILIPSAFSIPTHGMRQVQAENDVLALIDQAVEGLAGDLTKSRLQTVIDELENAREQMFTHGLEKVTREG